MVKNSQKNPLETDEFIDFYFHRVIAAVLVKILFRSSITPNQISVMSAVLGAFAGLTMILSIWWTNWWMAVGALILLGSIVLDCVDGQLARKRGTSSAMGDIFDGTMDIVAPVFVFHGIAFFLLFTTAQPPFGNILWRIIFIWVTGWLTAWSFSWHVAQFEGFKKVYLHCACPDRPAGKILISLYKIEEMKKEFKDKGEKFNTFLMNVWKYRFKEHEKLISPWLEGRCPHNEEERKLFVQAFKPTMRQFTWLGTGTHLFLLTLCCLLAPLTSWAIWIAWALIAGPLNILCFYLLRKVTKLTAGYSGKLREMRENSPEKS